MDQNAFSKLTLEERRGVMRLAELRVRAGESPPSVRAALGIPASTFTLAAAKGFWRQKDLKRQKEGLDPLPLADFARPQSKGVADTSSGDSQATPPTCDSRDLASLLEAAEANGAQALKYFQSGHTAKAEEKLKEAERLARLHRRLLAHVPPDPSPDELERRRVAAMTKTELIAEIKRRAGLS
ncbi:MAG: hypothetical protein AAGF33_11850 [Pseudomonadota bacterium]